MDLSNELVLSVLIYVLILGYLFNNYYNIIVNNSNVILLVAVGSFYLVQRITD